MPDPKNQTPEKPTTEKKTEAPAPRPENPVQEVEELGVDDGRITFERPRN